MRGDPATRMRPIDFERAFDEWKCEGGGEAERVHAMFVGAEELTNTKLATGVFFAAFAFTCAVLTLLVQVEWDNAANAAFAVGVVFFFMFRTDNELDSDALDVAAADEASQSPLPPPEDELPT